MNNLIMWLDSEIEERENDEGSIYDMDGDYKLGVLDGLKLVEREANKLGIVCPEIRSYDFKEGLENLEDLINDLRSMANTNDEISDLIGVLSCSEMDCLDKRDKIKEEE